MLNALTSEVGSRPAPARPPRPSEPLKETAISFNTQDGTVLSPTTITLRMGPGPSVEKARLEGPGITPNENGYVFTPSDERYHGAVSLAAVGRTIDLMEKSLGHKIDWAFRADKLGIVADAGEDLNAYYSRDDAGLRFFHADDPKTGKTVFSADSGEVVAHEAGHAILDGLRPGYFSTWSPDPAAFHEAFGDVVAMLVTLQDDGAVAALAKQTGGDLSKPNFLADTGEELGAAINHSVGRNVTGGDYVRTARNNFVWKDPSTLPDTGGPNELGSEAHSFARLWTGAFNDVLKGLTDANLAAGMSPEQALRAAGDESLKMYGNLFKTAPRGDFTFRDMAQAMIRADQQHNNGKNAALLTSVFQKRRILRTSEEVVPGEGPFASSNRAATLEDATRPVRVTLSGDQYGMFQGAVVETLVDKDGSLAKDAEVTSRVRKNLERLIASGRILYTEPGKPVTTRDLFDAKGRPYTGVVRWTDGQMSIERVKIAS